MKSLLQTRVTKFLITTAICLFTWAAPIKATELKSIHIFHQNINLTPDLCRETWKIRNHNSAECEFKIANSSASIDLSNKSIFARWAYDSNENWFINFWAQTTPYGFLVSATSEQNIPKDRLEFNVAQKYLKDLFASANNILVRSVAKADILHNPNFERHLGELKVYKRFYNLNSFALIEKCLDRVKKNQFGFSCVVPLLSSIRGELSGEDLLLTHHVQLQKGKIGLTLFSKKAWTESGTFSPLVLTARWNGLKDLQEFKSALAESLNTFDKNQFEISIYKPGSALINNELFNEKIFAETKTIQEIVEFDENTCEKNAQIIENRFECAVPLLGDEYFLQQNELSFFSDKSGKYQIKINRIRNRLVYGISSEDQIFESNATAIQLLRSILTEQNKAQIELKRIIKITTFIK
jgi:hypothetical protein